MSFSSVHLYLTITYCCCQFRGEGLLRAKLAKSEAKTLPTVGQKFNEANGSWLEKTQIEDVLNGQFELIKE